MRRVTNSQALLKSPVAFFAIELLPSAVHHDVLESADADSFDELRLGLDVKVGKSARLTSY